MRSPLSLRRRARRAFTIIELLVALGVTAIMITLMVNISINLLKAWNFTSGQLSAGNQARVALDYLSQDLQSAVLKRDGNVWLAATVQQDPGANGDENITDIFDTAWTLSGGNIKPDAGSSVAAGNSLDLAGTLPADNSDDGKIENVRFGKAGVWLRFFTTPPDLNTSAATTSAPRAVSYQISRGRIGGSVSEGQYFYALFRSEVRPDLTFTAGYNITDAATYDATAGTAGVIRTPTLNEIIANNVVDFGVRLYERDTNGALIEVFPTRRNAAGVASLVPSTVPVTYLGTTSTAAYARYGNSAATNLTPGIPVVAEVMVRILTPEGQRILSAYEEDTGNRTARPDSLSPGAYWWEIVNAHSRVYTRRIEIRGTAL